MEVRDRKILSTIVSTHISTGAPVASAAVADQYRRRLSSATIRNVMAVLADRGFLSQPHTSAGRVPTARAYEWYAQEVAAQAHLSPADQRRINRELAQGGASPEEFLARAPHVLAELCQAVALVLIAPIRHMAVEEVRFLPLSGKRVLAVVVTRGGLVCDKVFRTRDSYGSAELARMTAFLNQNFRGWTLEAICTEMERRVAAERSESRRFLLQALLLCQESCQSLREPSELHLEGLAHLLEQGAGVDREAVREVLRALEDKERLAQLLRDCLKNPEGQPHVRIGLEQLSPRLKEYSLVGTSYGQADRWSGSLGLLGPTRMDYARAITTLTYVAGLFNRAFREN